MSVQMSVVSAKTKQDLEASFCEGKREGQRVLKLVAGRVLEASNLD